MAKTKKGSFIREIVVYGLVGVVSTVIDMGLLKVATVLGWPYWLSLAIGFAGGTVNGYYMNSRWTFRYKTASQEGVKFAQFTIVSLIGLGLTEIIGNAYLSYLNDGISLVGHEIGPKMVGKLIAVAAVFFWNYFANKLWTFKKG